MRKSDKKAVDEALQVRDIDDLKKSFTDLNVTMAAGFKGVHERQDKTNGNVIHAQEDITTLKAKFEYNRIIWYCSTSISVVIALGSYIIFKH